ncbi:mycothiol system anti-sigma-R factor [uncultured Rothia sp.]|uniref:mycothiol system anti-sigma-R factor n=1 Tax=uncultured Rothia sp. TaxID=316088 RepID=UPI0026397752|nr:mycothiol system anti-sigma-R factor [uncultured Rothia sp.]
MSSTDKNSSVLEASATSEPLEDCGGQPCSAALKRLYEFLDRELSPEQLRRVQSHLDACPECADVKDFELMIREKMRSSCAQQAPKQLKARLLQDVQKFCAEANL